MARPVEVSFPLPLSPHSILHGQFTFTSGYAMIFLTTSELGDSTGSLSPLGSFVYAMPDRSNDKSTISTTLCTSGSSIDYATRLAKILARRLDLPVYAGCSMNFAGTTAEEELQGLTKIVDEIILASKKGGTKS